MGFKFLVVSLTLYLLFIYFNLCEGCVKNEREALFQFKHSLHDPYNVFSSWVGEDCCKWEGVGCNNRTWHVVKLDPFPYISGLVGREVSPSLTELKHLEYLDLRFVDFSGSEIPNFFGNFTRLRYLDLSYASFSGPIPFSLGNLSALEALCLNGNQLNGSIPSSLGQLSVLNRLDFTGNQLSGSIPSSLGELSSLEYLLLRGNQLTGRIPSSLGELSALESLGLSSNHLIGPIPSSLGKLSALTDLQLSDNQLTGQIPSSLGKLSALQYLQLSDNQLTGPVPSSFGNLSALVSLQLDSNRLTGVVSEIHFRQLSSLLSLFMCLNFLHFNMSSSWKPPFQLRYLNLQSCNLGPKIPQWLGTQMQLNTLRMSNSGISEVPTWFWNYTSRLSFLDLSSNQIHGLLPILQHNVSVNHQSLYLSSNRFEGPLPQFPPNVDWLDLSNNSISGPISENIAMEMPKLYRLVLSNNYINGSIPSSLCKLKDLKYIDLSNNHLSRIDCSFGNLLSLMSLHLNNNKFYGEIPQSLKHSDLVVLDLANNEFSGDIPSWFGEMSFLRILSLRSNSFRGSLSPQLCHMSELQIFDVSQNHLSGTIPPCIYNFSSMKLGQDIEFLNNGDPLSQVIKGLLLEYTALSLIYLVNFDLSSNNFVGHIPEGIVLLDGLTALNLSNNQLTGEIPRKIGNLTSLESLDFSRNMLSGTIPESMSDLGSLGVMNLSFNNLSGKIPTGHQLQTFVSSSYTGNPQLCGFPVEKNCSQEAPSHVIDHHEGKVDGGDDRNIEFYISLVIGIVAGFWGFCAVLLFKKTWRYILFQFVERMHDRLLLTIALFVLRLKRKLGSV